MARLATICFALSAIAACATPTPPIPDRLALGAAPVVMMPARDRVARNDAATTPIASLDLVVLRAIENNPTLRADFARFEAMLLDVPQVSSLPDPMAETEVMQRFAGPEDMRENTVRISQTFPWFGKQRLRAQLADSTAREALEEYNTAVLDLRRDVTSRWHEVAFARAQRELVSEELELVQKAHEATASLYAVGQRGREAMLRLQTELARSRETLADLDAEIAMGQAELRRMIGESTATFAPVAPEEGLQEFTIPDAESLVALALEIQPELARYDRQREQALLTERLAQADYYPDFTVGVGYQGAGDRPGGIIAPLADDRTDSWSAMIGMNIPLPNARRRAAREQALKRLEEAKLRREATANEIIEEIELAHARIEALVQRMTILRRNILPLAEETRGAMQAAYESGQATLVDLIDAQRAILAVRRDLLIVRRDYYIALADLECAVCAPLVFPDSAPEANP
ncbi:MAG: TolC family protein [Candidatus Sumerlaeia bacterium]|nr:TolC family protein [Candidatus Sumerlaeia bacterium]